MEIRFDLYAINAPEIESITIWGEVVYALLNLDAPQSQ